MSERESKQSFVRAAFLGATRTIFTKIGHWLQRLYVEMSNSPTQQVSLFLALCGVSVFADDVLLFVSINYRSILIGVVVVSIIFFGISTLNALVAARRQRASLDDPNKILKSNVVLVLRAMPSHDKESSVTYKELLRDSGLIEHEKQFHDAISEATRIDLIRNIGGRYQVTDPFRLRRFIAEVEK